MALQQHREDKYTAQIAEAYQLFRTQKFDAAKKLCKKILDKYADSLQATHLMGAIEYQANNLPRALQLIRRAHALAPDNTEIIAQLAGLMVEAGDEAGAITVYERLALLNPGLASTYALLAQQYRKTDKIEQGINALTVMFERSPNQIAIPLELSRLSREIGRLREAESFANDALRLAPDSCEAMVGLGVTALNRKDYAAGIIALENAASSKANAFCADVSLEMKADATMIQGLASTLAVAPSGKNHQLPRDAWESDAIAALSSQMGSLPSASCNVVFFHVDANDKHPFLGKSKNALNIDYKNTLAISCVFAERACKDASVFILTNMTSDLSGIPNSVRILRADVNPDHMMYSRMRAYRALAMTGLLRAPALFLDTDVCINEGTTAVFDGTFDIGLTYRTEEGFWHMPVNEGVLMAANDDPRKTNQFFGENLDIYESLAQQAAVKARYAFDVKMWRGGQLSLATLIDWNAPPIAASRQDIRGVRYKFFPGVHFNYSVSPDDSHEFLRSRQAVHFKGAQSKARMTTYYAANASTQRKSDLRKGS